nr:PLP-dependent transferase [Angustibacter aerolatus]
MEHPGQMTHASAAGSLLEVPNDLVRLSVGIEDGDDLLADLEQALSRPRTARGPGGAPRRPLGHLLERLRHERDGAAQARRPGGCTAAASRTRACHRPRTGCPVSRGRRARRRPR